MAVKISFNILGERCGRLFVQRWMELLHPLTMDTYSAKLLNSHLALQEMQKVIIEILQSQVKYFNLIEVWDETREIVINDPVIENKSPLLFNLSKKRLTQGPKDNPADLNKALRIIKSILKILEPNYLNWTLQLIEETFCTQNDVLCQKLASILATEVLQYRDVHSLYDLAYLFDSEHSPSFEEAMTKFNNVITKGEESFNIYLGVTGSSTVLERFCEQFKIEFSSKDQLVTLGLPPERTSINSFVSFGVQAYDYRSAFKVALFRFRKYIDLYEFYHQKNIPNLERKFISMQPTHPEKGWKITPIVDDSTNVTSDLEQQLLQTISLFENVGLSKDSYIRLRGLIQYINLSKKAYSQEVSFLNSWVALESFTKMEGDTIKNIKEFIPPIICIRYPYKLLKNFIEDSKRNGIREFRSIDPWELLSILKNDTTRYNYLLNECNTNELIGFRFKELKNIFNNGKNLFTAIDCHKKNLEWHLQRLYRIRNAIVHSADSPFGLDRCLRHLNEYVWTVFSEVAMRLSSNPNSAIEDILVQLKDTFDITIDELRGSDNYDESILIDGPF